MSWRGGGGGLRVEGRRGCFAVKGGEKEEGRHGCCAHGKVWPAVRACFPCRGIVCR